MDARTRVLVADFSLAAGAASVGALGTAGPLGWTAAIALFGAGVLVVSLYLAEQTPLLELVGEYSPGSYVAAFALTLAVGLVLVLGRAVVASPPATLLLGAGLGLGGYRLRYGVLSPVPERRLAEASGGLDLDPPGQS